MRKEALTTSGFIDSASIHGALAALTLGKSGNWCEWDRQSLLETTYLLLHDSIRLMAGPGPYSGASGPYQYVISAFPELESRKLRRDLASQKTKRWLRERPHIAKRAWQSLLANPMLEHWSEVQRELFWKAHAQMYGALFNMEFLTPMSTILECSAGDLANVHRLSGDISRVESWAKDSSSEAAKLAGQAWLLSALLRGKYHEYLAGDDTQLVSHPHRASIGAHLKSGQQLPVLNTEQHLVRIIVGSALRENTTERRIRCWVDNIARARRAISLRQVGLVETALDSDSRRIAVEAAARIGIPGTSLAFRRAIEWALASGLGAIVSVTVSPWAGLAAVGLSPALQQSYRYLRGASIGEDLSKACFSTQRWYEKLARSVPGRVDRDLRPAE